MCVICIKRCNVDDVLLVKTDMNARNIISIFSNIILFFIIFIILFMFKFVGVIVFKVKTIYNKIFSLFKDFIVPYIYDCLDLVKENTTKNKFNLLVLNHPYVLFIFGGLYVIILRQTTLCFDSDYEGYIPVVLQKTANIVVSNPISSGVINTPVSLNTVPETPLLTSKTIVAPIMSQESATINPVKIIAQLAKDSILGKKTTYPFISAFKDIALDLNNNTLVTLIQREYLFNLYNDIYSQFHTMIEEGITNPEQSEKSIRRIIYDCIKKTDMIWISYDSNCFKDPQSSFSKLMTIIGHQYSQCHDIHGRHIIGRIAAIMSIIQLDTLNCPIPSQVDGRVSFHLRDVTSTFEEALSEFEKNYCA